MRRALILPPTSWCRHPLFHTGKHESLRSAAAVGSASKVFLGKWMYLFLPAWNFGLHHFHELADYEETARQPICKDDGCRRQQAAGANGCITTFSPFWPPCPVYVLSLL